MRSELLRIPMTWGGVPIFGFGVLLVVWLCLGAWALTSTAKQVGWAASLKAHLPTVLIVAGLIVFGIPKFFPDGAPLRSYGLLVLAGSVAGIAMTIYRAKQAGLEADDILGLAVLVFIGGVIGARLFYVVEYWDGRIRTETWAGTIKNILAFTEGGLVVYGAFAGAVAGYTAYALRHKLPALATADIIAPSLMVGLAFGRIGCLLNGCCYGGESNVPWAITFPRENAPKTSSPPYAEQASEGRLFGFRIGERAGDPKTIVVEQVDASSRAAAAGLQVGDVLTSISLEANKEQPARYHGPIGGTLAGIDAAHPMVVTLIDPKSRELLEVHLKSPLSAAQWLLFAALDGGMRMTIATPAGERTLEPRDPPARSLPVHPAQIYSSIDAALLGWVLWSFYPYRRRDGEVIALMLMLHPISRFLLEAIRIDEAPVWGTGLSISQNLRGGLFAIGAGLWLYLRRNPAGNLAFPLPAPAASEPKHAPVR